MRKLGSRASMAQIAREAGLTPAALYQRFPTPDVLRSRLAEAFYDRLLTHAEQSPSLPVDQLLSAFCARSACTWRSATASCRMRAQDCVSRTVTTRS
ncbi:TetR family transcriptional regulator [Streptomyces sp. NPDC014006]|uniref:TetR family transcriptional regulator n=1 Tax=Streptomyces sp. NPDC014006 TaxID=3364870 RepID=UPI0036FCA845